MLTSNVTNVASIEFITQKNHIKWYYMIWLCFRPFLAFCVTFIRGRPKRRFMDVVKEDMAEVEVTEEDTVCNV